MLFRIMLLMLCISPALFAQSLETVIQKGHELAVLTIATSSDSNYVATGSKDKSAKLWDLTTGREVRSFLGHEASVTAVAFSPDAKLILTGSNDKSIKLWDVFNGKEQFSYATGDYITSVVIDPQQRFLLYAGYNNSGYGDSAVVLNWSTKHIIKKLPVNAEKGLGSGVDAAVSADGKWLALGEDNHVVNVYSTKDWTLFKTFTKPEGYCGGCGSRVRFSPDSKFLYTVSHRGPLKKYDISTGELKQTFETEVDDLTGFDVSHDGKRLVVSTEESVRVYDAATGAVVQSYSRQSSGKYHEISFSIDGKRVLVATDDNVARIYSASSGKEEKPLTGFLNQRDQGDLNYDPNFYWQTHIAKYVRYKNTILLSNDGKTLIKGKFGKKVKRWDIMTGRTVMEYIGHKKAVLCYKLSKDGKRLLTGGGDGKIMLFNLETGDSLQVIKAYREPIFDIHFNAEETQIVSSSWDGTARIHDLTTGNQLTYLDLSNASAYNVLFHTNGLYVFTARLDNTVQMWETDTRSVVRSFVGHTDIITSLRLSADQKTLLTAGWDGSIRLWDVGTGLMTKKISNGKSPIHTAVFSPDEKFIYAAGADRTITVFEISSGRIIKRFEGHKAEITSIIISPDAKMLISHSLDGVTKFWDLNTGREFFEHIHLGDKDWLVKSPEGFFNGTDEARKHIHFVSGKKTYSVDQFFNNFYRPDLLPKSFQQRGSSDESKGIPGKLKNAPPPTIKVAAVPSEKNNAELYVRIIDNGGGAANLRVLHNGKSIAVNATELTYPSSKGAQTTYKQTVALVGGTNTFTAVATNKDNVESDPRSVELFTESGEKHSNCYILSVGINEYKNNKLNLNYARPDAESFSKVVNEFSASLFQNIYLETLYDKDATKANILARLDELASKIQQEDVFLLYYAGHGSMVDNKFYFIPTENARLYDGGALHKEAVEATLLQERLKKIKALKQLIIMDACQSGGSVELLATRGANEEKAIAQLSRSSGIHVLASAGSEQFATEFAELGHGLFTFVLLKALQGAADGAPKDGKVTIYELKSYIDDQVPEMTRKLKGKPQYPYTFSRGQDFPIVINVE